MTNFDYDAFLKRREKHQRRLFSMNMVALSLFAILIALRIYNACCR